MSFEATINYDKIIEIVAENEGIRKYTKEIESGASKGENYLGIIAAITIEGEDVEGKEKVSNLIVKTCSSNEKLRKELMLRKAYEIEVCMYDKVFPAFRCFQNEKGVAEEEGFNSAVRCLYTSLSSPHETLVFEDLKSSGYKQWDMKVFMNPEHVAFVLEEYGKFHAVSFAMRDQQKEVFDALSIDSDSDDDVYENIWWKLIQRNFGKVVELFDNSEPEKEYLKEVEEGIGIFFDDSLKFDEYSAISHGDCWCNNMMFKYNSLDADPKEMRFLDFQLARKSNPLHDVTHFFYCNSSKDIYANDEVYMKIYYDSFSKHLKALGSAPESMYPWKVFQEHWRIFSKRALTIAMIVLKMAISDQNEIPDMAQSLEDGNSAYDAFNYSITKEDLYVERIKDLVTHMMKRSC